MNRCKFCHNLIWPWQSYFMKPEIEQQENNTILINPNYDRWMHQGCYFRMEYTYQVQGV